MSLPAPYWTDGERWIYRGDCRELLREIDPADIGMVGCDVPYGIGLENHGGPGRGGGFRRAESYDIAGDRCTSVGQAVIDYAWDKVPLAVFASPWKMWPGDWNDLIVWNKGGAVGGGGDTRTRLKRTWELIQVRSRVPLGDGRDESVWDHFMTVRDYEFHIAAKPISLCCRLIKTYARPGTVILDPCCGSGPMLIAAARLGYPAIGIDVDGGALEKTVRRLSDSELLFSAAV